MWLSLIIIEKCNSSITQKIIYGEHKKLMSLSIQMKRFTYESWKSIKQCVAVITQDSVINAPPQNVWLFNVSLAC